MNCIEGPSETTFKNIYSDKKGYDSSTLETILLVRSHTNSIGVFYLVDLLPDPLD